MTKPATTTPSPEFNIPDTGEPKKEDQPDPSPGESQQLPEGGQRPGPQVNLERLKREEEMQDEPDAAKEDG